MNLIRFATMLACVAPFLAGCEGVRFANNVGPTNLTPPGELKTVVPAANYQTALTSLVGTIAIYNKAEKSIQVIEQIYDPYDPRTRPVVEAVKTTLYKSLVTKNMITDIPVIASAVKDAATNSLEVTVTNEAHAYVPKYYTDILNYFGAKYRPTNPNEELVYVSDVHLYHLNATMLTPADINARDATKPIYGYNGMAFTRTDNFKDDRYLSISIVPFSRIASVKPGEALEPYPQGTVQSVKAQITNPQPYYAAKRYRDGIYGGGYYGNYRSR